MEVSDIIENSLKFPADNLKQLGIYIGLYILIILLFAFAIISLVSIPTFNSSALIIVPIIFAILALIVYFIIGGYKVEIIKTGVNHENQIPAIQFKESFILGVKFFIVQFIYMLIPLIVVSVLLFTTASVTTFSTKNYLMNQDIIFSSFGFIFIIGLILFFIFSFFQCIGNGRLAETGSLGHALNIPEVIGDISKIGAGKVFLTILILLVILVVINMILTFIPFIGPIIGIIVSPYLVFSFNRGNGLLYADVNE